MAKRPRRTREHIIASQSHNYIEKFFIDKGHTVARPPEDYGTDVLVNTFDKDGYAENGDIRLQLKGRRSFTYTKDGSQIRFRIEAKHYDLWLNEPGPIFLVLYDASNAVAYYLYLQEYLTGAGRRRPKPNATWMTVHVPVANRFTEATVDYMRERKAAILNQIRGRVRHES